MAHFDWYAASYRGEHGTCLDALCGGLGGELGKMERGHKGFQYAVRVRGARGLHALVQWGGVHQGLVHAAFSGGRSGDCAKVFRQAVPSHRVSRVDVAEDVAGPDAFAALDGISARTARRYRLKRTRILPDDSGAGASVYLGSRSSPVFCRIYEKGKQVMAGSDHVDLEALPVDLKGEELSSWVRCEIEVKPKHPLAREALASMPVESFWGCSDWTNDLRDQLGHAPVERLQVGSVWRASDDERLWRSLVSQYGAFLERQASDLGSWECVGLQASFELQELRKLRGCGGG